MTGYKNDDVEEEVNHCIRDSKFNQDKIKIIYNSEFEKGMFSSLQVGLNELLDCNWLLYHFVDQPQIPQKFYQDFIIQIEENYDWIQPHYGNKNGHPILINKSLFLQILNSKINSLKEISRAQSVKKKFWNCKYPKVVEDIDTKEDYQKLT